MNHQKTYKNNYGKQEEFNSKIYKKSENIIKLIQQDLNNIINRVNYLERIYNKNNINSNIYLEHLKILSDIQSIKSTIEVESSINDIGTIKNEGLIKINSKILEIQEKIEQLIQDEKLLDNKDPNINKIEDVIKLISEPKLFENFKNFFSPEIQEYGNIINKLKNIKTSPLNKEEEYHISKLLFSLVFSFTQFKDYLDSIFLKQIFDQGDLLNKFNQNNKNFSLSLEVIQNLFNQFDQNRKELLKKANLPKNIKQLYSDLDKILELSKEIDSLLYTQDLKSASFSINKKLIKIIKNPAFIIFFSMFLYGIGINNIFANEKYIQDRHDIMNHSFSLDQLKTDFLARQLIITSSYDYVPFFKKNTHKLAEYIAKDNLFFVPQVGGIILRAADITNLDEIKKTTDKIKEKNPSALIVMDFEGGYIRAPFVTKEQFEVYKFPNLIHDLRKKEYEESKKKHKKEPKYLSQFPSAEFIGTYYQSLKNQTEKNNFLLIMEQYGESIANMLSDAGVHMIFGPSLDITDNKIGTINETPFAKNDRSFSNNSKIVSDLGNAFIRGALKIPFFIAIPKHYVGVGLALKDTDIQTAEIQKLSEGAILPFKDYINMFEIENLTPEQIKNKITSENSIKLNNETKLQELKIQSKNIKIKINNEKLAIKKNKKNLNKYNQKIIKLNKTLKNINDQINNIQIENNKISKQINHFSEELNNITDTPPIIMLGNMTLKQFGLEKPSTLSPSLYTSIRKDLAKTNINKLGGMGNNGLIITDALDAGAIEEHLKNKNMYFDSAKSATNSGADILLFGTAPVDNILQGIKNGINENELKVRAKRILDLKVALGIYIKNGNIYTLNANQYNPTFKTVLEDGDNSRIWPFTNTKEAYEQEEGKIEKTSIKNLIINSGKNFILNKCRINPSKFTKLACSINSQIYDSYNAPNENNLKKQLIIIDKGYQKLYAYDFETRQLLYEKKVAIGKGTKALNYLHDKKISGDKKTPIGYYIVVQKKNPTMIKNTIEEDLYNEYGGNDGGMLVLAGAWHPQIAIHGTKGETEGPVSHGCIRVDNTHIKKMLNEVPLGSFVIITN